ncbi:MAG TPA: hypothetical protein VHO68_01240 [Bacteroidales bacterium]|nr:hypothetical protein [Bacteroidales bacterium]
MAEIKVEKRKPVWPWILAGLAVLAIVIFLIAGNDNNRDRKQSAAYDTERDSRNNDSYGDNDKTVTGRNNDRDHMSDNKKSGDNMMGNSDKKEQRQVADFVKFVRTDLREEKLDHRNLKRAFNELQDATEAIAKNSGYPEENLEDTKEYVDMIDQENFEEKNAEQVRRTADVFADHLQKMQRAKFPQLETDALQLMESTKKISTSQPAIDQSTEIRSFLAEAADLVEKME